MPSLVRPFSRFRSFRAFASKVGELNVAASTLAEGSSVPLSRKHLEALKDELNVVGSGAIVAAGFFLGLPLLIPFVWLGYEAAYLLFVPDSGWYDRRLGRKA